MVTTEKKKSDATDSAEFRNAMTKDSVVVYTANLIRF
jgi:hypothetical protein